MHVFTFDLLIFPPFPVLFYLIRITDVLQFYTADSERQPLCPPFPIPPSTCNCLAASLVIQQRCAPVSFFFCFFFVYCCFHKALPLLRTLPLAQSPAIKGNCPPAKCLPHTAPFFHKHMSFFLQAPNICRVYPSHHAIPSCSPVPPLSTPLRRTPPFVTPPLCFSVRDFTSSCPLTPPIPGLLFVCPSPLPKRPPPCTSILPPVAWKPSPRRVTPPYFPRNSYDGCLSRTV